MWLTDSEGNKVLDGMAALWCVNVGYGRDQIVDAVIRQLRELPYYNTFFQCTHPPAAEFSEALCAAAPEQMNRVFFTNSGSESNDTVFRLARIYWDCLGKPSKKVFISRQNAYHGLTLCSASLGGMAPACTASRAWRSRASSISASPTGSARGARWTRPSPRRSSG